MTEKLPLGFTHTPAAELAHRATGLRAREHFATGYLRCQLLRTVEAAPSHVPAGVLGKRSPATVLRPGPVELLVAFGPDWTAALRRWRRGADMAAAEVAGAEAGGAKAEVETQARAGTAALATRVEVKATEVAEALVETAGTDAESDARADVGAATGAAEAEGDAAETPETAAATQAGAEEAGAGMETMAPTAEEGAGTAETAEPAAGPVTAEPEETEAALAGVNH